MADKYDEVSIMGRAYDELKALPRDGQRRAMHWLDARLQSDFEHAMKERLSAEKAKQEQAKAP